MLYEALGNENTDKWSSDNCHIELLFYFKIYRLSHYLVNIDKLVNEFVEGEQAC